MRTLSVTFFTAVINVDISSISGRGDEIFDGLYITTDKTILSDLLVPEVRLAIGGLEHDFLSHAPAIIYSRKDIADEFDWSKYLSQQLMDVKMFFNVMWLLKDNAADSELGFLTYPIGLTRQTHSNALSVTYNMADGSRSMVSFSRPELKDVRSYYRAWIAETVSPTPFGILDSTGVGRVARAFYWIQAGRATPGLGQRIACFCTAMESLFATSSTELAHQLAERMAVFLSDGPAERARVYGQVKKAYRLRSRVVHGDVLRHARISELVETSVDCDGLLRQAIYKTIVDEAARKALDSGNESLDRYFVELLFGREQNG